MTQTKHSKPIKQINASTIKQITPMTFKNYLLAKGFSKSTTEVYQKELLIYITWCDINNIEAEEATYNEVIGYVQKLRKQQVSQATIQKYLNSIKHYYNWLVKRNLRTDNPVLNINIKGIKRRILHDILNKQELEKIYFDYKNSPSKTLSKKRNEIIISLLIYQGLNTNSLKNLEVQDIKLREGKIHIKSARRSNERTLKLEAHQVLDLMDYTLQVRQLILNKTNKETDLLLVSLGTSSDLNGAITKLIKTLKKQDKKVQNLKQIRASVITNWLKNYNLREVQYFAGHRFVSSTEAYLINDLEDLQEDIEKYHPTN